MMVPELDFVMNRKTLIELASWYTVLNLLYFLIVFIFHETLLHSFLREGVMKSLI